MKKKDTVQNSGNSQVPFEDAASRRRKVISVYVQSTGSSVQVYDSGLKLVETGDESDTENSICRFCTAGSDGSCRQMHVDRIGEAGGQGKPVSYNCALGLIFWVSPIYSGGKVSGALRGSGFLSRQADDQGFAEFCASDVSRDKFVARLCAMPVADAEKTASLAEMLHLCSQSLSDGAVNYHEMLRSRHEQQSSIYTMVEDLKKKHSDRAVSLGYPLGKERSLISALRQGDKKASGDILNEILAILVYDNKDNFSYLQLRALELTVLIARVGTSLTSASTVESYVRYLKSLQDSKTVEELVSILHNVTESVAEQVVSFQGLPHASAMRKAESFIRENLTRKISLGEIARIAGLSAPYFSTIFKEEMGENLSSYVNRQRVEKAGKLLLETDLALSEIATMCCFQDQSWFSKIFKSFTGISPGKYRRQGGAVSALRSNIEAG